MLGCFQSVTVIETVRFDRVLRRSRGMLPRIQYARAVTPPARGKTQLKGSVRLAQRYWRNVPTGGPESGPLDLKHIHMIAKNTAAPSAMPQKPTQYHVRLVSLEKRYR